MRKHRRAFVLIALGLLLALAAGVSIAEDKDTKMYQKQFEQWSRVIADLKQADPGGAATADIEVIRTWIGQAQAFLASEKLDQISPLLSRIEAQAEYIRTKLDRLASEEAAQKAEDQSAAAEKQAQEATAAADAAEAKVKELEAKGL